MKTAALISGGKRGSIELLVNQGRRTMLMVNIQLHSYKLAPI